MKDFENHVQAMHLVLREYCEQNGILGSVSGLLIVREVGSSGIGEPLPIAIVGEPAHVALMTCHHAIEILTPEVLRQQAMVVGKVAQA